MVEIGKNANADEYEADARFPPESLPLFSKVFITPSSKSVLHTAKMATFHCYCALCSCSLGSYELGSKKPEALRRRRARVARRIYWWSRGHSCYYETEDEEEEEKEERLRRMPETDSGIAEEDDDDESERASYDPELLDRDGLYWLHLLGALGMHYFGSGAGPDAPRYVCSQSV